ncbi:MAG TPA: alpha-E domain-containing protein [Candidatus Binataceae bacterium]|nr:alpha-E domain-containing protein [Candidatus Binataceae bacterium]
MLRRIADHLFWMARYLERAEWRARLADVNYHLLVESPTSDPHPWAPLLAITGDNELFAQYYEAPSETQVLDFFTFELRNPSSILTCINAARDNARNLRHRLSSELWLEINTLYLEAQGWSHAVFDQQGVYGFFNDLRNRFHRLAGISYATLPRDIEFDVMTVGTMLERAENVSRLLDSKYHHLLPRVEDIGGTVDRMQWAAVLRSASALEAYRRVYGNHIIIDGVVEFLLFDAGFPRSCRFCIDQLQEAAARIEHEAGSQPAITAPGSPGAKLAMALRGGSTEGVLRSGLHEFLMEVQDLCADIGSMIFDKYLRFE